MPEYRSADLARSATLDDAADELYQEGTAAKSYDDKYILSTVFFAAVLFFAGISLRAGLATVADRGARHGAHPAHRRCRVRGHTARGITA